jgi:invasion protein IalB
MKDRRISATLAFAAPIVRRAVAAVAISVVAAMAVAPQSLAQQPKDKGQPKGPPAQQKGPPSTQDQTLKPQGEPQIAFTSWTKVCPKSQEANAKRVCFTGKDGRIEGGMLVVAAVVIEVEGDARKVLRVTLPLGVALQPGTRVVVDQGQPMNAPYVICFPAGCVADYEASLELIDKLKKGQSLHVQGVNGQGQPVSLALPLADFAKAHDGPPSEQMAEPNKK